MAPPRRGLYDIPHRRIPIRLHPAARPDWSEAARNDNDARNEKTNPRSVERTAYTPRALNRLSSIIDPREMAENPNLVVRSPSSNMLSEDGYINHPDRPLSVRERQGEIKKRVEAATATEAVGAEPIKNKVEVATATAAVTSQAEACVDITIAPLEPAIPAFLAESRVSSTDHDGTKAPSSVDVANAAHANFEAVVNSRTQDEVVCEDDRSGKLFEQAAGEPVARTPTALRYIRDAIRKLFSACFAGGK